MCSIEVEDTSHYRLQYYHFSHHRVDLMNRVKSVCDNFETLSDNVKNGLALYGDSRFVANKNFVLEATISYIENSEKFSGSFFE